jgi:hypothetical protein
MKKLFEGTERFDFKKRVDMFFKNIGYDISNIKHHGSVKKTEEGYDIYSMEYRVITSFIQKRIMLELYMDEKGNLYVYDYEIMIHKDLDEPDMHLAELLASYKGVML